MPLKTVFALLAMTCGKLPNAWVVGRRIEEPRINRDRAGSHTWRVIRRPRRFYVHVKGCVAWECEDVEIEVSEHLFGTYRIGDKFPAWRMP